LSADWRSCRLGAGEISPVVCRLSMDYWRNMRHENGMATPTMTIEKLIENAAFLGHESHTVALAATVCGITAHSLCCWCAETVAPGGLAIRLPTGGECERCSYVGQDCLVVVPS